MPPSDWPPLRATALLLALASALLVFRVNALPLVGPDEPRYVRVAVEMHRASEWVRPTLQSRPWLEKPPLYFWLTGALFHVLGETETAARLPSLLSTVLLVAATTFLGTRLVSVSAGLHSGFVLATAVLPFIYGLAASMDMLLATPLTIGTGLLGLRLLGLAGPAAVPTAYACLGLATLAKGPVGVLLPALVVGSFLLITRDRGAWRRVISPTALLIMIIVAGPWYAAIIADQGGAFVTDFLLGHNLRRFTSTVHNHPGAFYYYLPVVLGGLFPWSGLALPALSGLRPRSSRADLFLVLWLALPLAFFSAAGSKLPGYILPCLPPLAILMGRACSELAAERVGRVERRLAAVLGLVLAALIATAPFLLARRGEPAWTTAVPVAIWSLAITFLFSRTVMKNGSAALALLRVGGAGLLLLVGMIAPPIVARHESGRRLFLPARGREVLAFGAWRTAWMAGYFYNDGHVREVEGEAEILAAVARGPVLVLCGPSERRRLESAIGLTVQTLVTGPRGNALIKLSARGSAPASPS